MRSFVRASDADRFGPELVPVCTAAVAALASERWGTPASTDAELRVHARITQRVHETAPSLPARFPMVFADHAALAQALAQRESALAAELGTLGERVELAVTLTWRTPRPAPALPADASGRAYLEARAAREHEEREAEQIVERLIAELSVEPALIRQRICPRGGVAATVAALIERDEEMNVRRRIATFERNVGAVTAAVYGPLPPFSFVS